MEDIVGRVMDISGDEVLFESQISPPLRYRLSALLEKKPVKAPPPTTAGGIFTAGLMRLIRPRFVLRVAGREYTAAPWGPPEKNYSALVVVGSVLVFAGGIWALTSFKKRLKKRKSS